jgi:predicted site-specific integrase-resolvase
MDPGLLTPNDLAERWKLTPATLSQWRWNGKGPYFMKLGRRILYRIEDVENFEQEQRRQNTCVSKTWRIFPVKKS